MRFADCGAGMAVQLDGPLETALDDAEPFGQFPRHHVEQETRRAGAKGPQPVRVDQGVVEERFHEQISSSEFLRFGR